MKPVKKVLSVRNYKAGYVIKKELHDGKPYGGKDIVLRSAYTPEGDYIGNPKMARFLCEKREIAPEPARKGEGCSIGKSTKDGKWYGWSHRAIAGFKTGSVVKKGDCIAEEGTLRTGFKAKTQTDAKRMAKAFARSGS